MWKGCPYGALDQVEAELEAGRAQMDGQQAEEDPAQDRCVDPTNLLPVADSEQPAHFTAPRCSS